MHVDRINRYWKPTRLAKVVNRMVNSGTERPTGFPSKASRVLLAWKRTNHLVEIRCKANAAVSANDYLEIRFSRAELFTMVARFLDQLPAEELLKQIENHASLSHSSTNAPQ